MRSLFHSPFPCTQPPSQQPSPTATAPLQPEMCYRPHPAPMHRQRRSPALLSAACPLPGPALTGPWPTVTRSQGACHAAPPSLPRAAARPHRAPSPEYRPAAPAPIGLASSASRPSRAVARIASTPLRAAIRIPLCRHRADSALIAPPSRPSCAAAVLRVLRFAVRIAPTVRRRPRHPPHLSPRVAAAPGPGWQEPHRMHPLFAECAKKAPFLATSARNACFSRSRWQHPRPMHPFPGAIGRFRIHGARILPPRVLFRVGEPEITHGAKMLPAPRGLSAAAACGPAERALRHAAAACDTRHGRTGFAPCGTGLACLPHAPPPVISLVPAAARVHRRRLIRVALRRPHCVHRAQPSGTPPIAVGMSRLSVSSCCPRAAPRRRIAPTDARSPAPPEPQPAPTGPRP